MVRDCISKIPTTAHPTQMHAPIRRLLLVASVLAMRPSDAAELIFDQTLSSTNWSISSGSTSSNPPTVQFLSASGAIQLSGGRHALRFFTTSGTQVVSAGQTLEVTFDLIFPTSAPNVDNGLRVGLFNSAGATRPPSGLSGTAAARQDAFLDYEGYVFGWNPNPGATNSNKLHLYERNAGLTYPSATRLLSTLTDIYSDPMQGSYSPSGEAFVAGITYKASYSVTGLSGSSGLRFDFSITNEPSAGLPVIQFSNSVTVANPSTSAFDAFAILAHSSVSSFQIDTVKVNIGSASTADFNQTNVPEPSTYALGAGLAALGLAVWRRRRKV